jgi:predicted molibdopterin-dependent oxidoreductase YjgC
VGVDADWDAAVRALGSARLVLVLDLELDAGTRGRIGPDASVVILGTAMSELDARADVILPVTNMVEENGTFVNRDGRVQRYMQARMAPGMARPAWWVAGEALALADRAFDPPSDAAQAFAVLADTIPAFGGLTWAALGLSGRTVRESSAAGAAR